MNVTLLGAMTVGIVPHFDAGRTKSSDRKPSHSTA
jgi:hypothetical protein